MRSNLSRQARQCLRSVERCRYANAAGGIRWSSTETRQWSTPLAKQLSEAITVYILTSYNTIRLLICNSGYGTNSARLIHANVPYRRCRRLLHV